MLLIWRNLTYLTEILGTHAETLLWCPETCQTSAWHTTSVKEVPCLKQHLKSVSEVLSRFRAAFHRRVDFFI